MGNLSKMIESFIIKKLELPYLIVLNKDMSNLELLVFVVKNISQKGK